MADPRSGFSGAMRSAIAGADPIEDEAEELDLFGDDAESGSPVGGMAFARRTHDAGEQMVHRLRGRPKGSRNISTKAMRDFILANYRHPLLGIADVASTPPDQLVRLILPRDSDGELLKNSKGEKPQISKDDLKWAFALWKECTFELAEYVATKQPRVVVDDVPLPPELHVHFGGSSWDFGPVINQQLGLPENPEQSTYWGEEAEEVPQPEVPQDD